MSSLGELGGRYDSACAELVKLNEASKNLRKTKQEIVEVLQQYMKQNGLTEMRFGSFMVKLSKQKPKTKKLSKDEISNTLKSLFRQKDYDKIMDELFSDVESDVEVETDDKIVMKKLKS